MIEWTPELEEQTTALLIALENVLEELGSDRPSSLRDVDELVTKAREELRRFHVEVRLAGATA